MAAYAIASRGLSTRVAPSAIETSIARTMRKFATPTAARGAVNPVPVTPEVLDEALAPQLPRKPTRPTLASKRRRLEGKSRRGEIKSGRQRVDG